MVHGRGSHRELFNYAVVSQVICDPDEIFIQPIREQTSSFLFDQVSFSYGKVDGGVKAFGIKFVPLIHGMTLGK